MQRWKSARAGSGSRATAANHVLIVREMFCLALNGEYFTFETGSPTRLAGYVEDGSAWLPEHHRH